MTHPIRVPPPPVQAMKPTMPVLQGLQASAEAVAQQYDAATRHPVFFSDAIQRVPLLRGDNSAQASPVALGYGYPKMGPRL
ncbi:hypothetical protein PFICI_04494 [Pestalotiopsis fici W106-1]|uniref:Uncharacterized protein n=1 Tax=Pestalotiopsis fici (strain W106-1 / CGMCC3.15140) TaxID=1229662 RepID=W3X918_PESFW|nr:uncharacterized protein PFICI_04494 [Pestalotiopsis fici W106-1]ETS82618.1 hypothetical protein PFICI_04494 [Pestalotiopsis fici W106-1]